MSLPLDTEITFVNKAALIFTDNLGAIIFAVCVFEKTTTLLSDDKSEIIFDDPRTYLAVIKTNIKNKKIIINEIRPDVGSEICLISNSFGLDLNITCGIVSANRKSGIGFNPIEDFIQIDASANPGSSGGAVVNSKGELVGIMSGIFTKESDTNVGVNFAISAELLIKTVKHLIK